MSRNIAIIVTERFTGCIVSKWFQGDGRKRSQENDGEEELLEATMIELTSSQQNERVGKFIEEEEMNVEDEDTVEEGLRDDETMNEAESINQTINNILQWAKFKVPKNISMRLRATVTTFNDIFRLKLGRDPSANMTPMMIELIGDVIIKNEGYPN